MSANLLATACEGIGASALPLSLQSEELTLRDLSEAEQKVVDFVLPKSIESLDTQQLINFLNSFLQAHQAYPQVDTETTRNLFNKLRARHAGLVAGVEALRLSNKQKLQSTQPRRQLDAWAEDLTNKENELLHLSEVEQQLQTSAQDLETELANLESVKLGLKSEGGLDTPQTQTGTPPDIQELADKLKDLKALCSEYELKAKEFEVEKDKACQDDTTLQTLIDKVGKNSACTLALLVSNQDNDTVI